MQRNCPPRNSQNKVCADCEAIHGFAHPLRKLRLVVVHGSLLKAVMAKEGGPCRHLEICFLFTQQTPTVAGPETG